VEVFSVDLTYEQWTHIFASAGIILLFWSYWIEHSRLFNMHPKVLYIGKLIGGCLIAFVLFSKWFFSEQIILISALSIVAAACFRLFLRRRGI